MNLEIFPKRDLRSRLIVLGNYSSRRIDFVTNETPNAMEYSHLAQRKFMQPCLDTSSILSRATGLDFGAFSSVE